MTVTNKIVTEALAMFDRCNLNAAKVGQANVWVQVINDAVPLATDATLVAAAKAIAATRTSEGKGGSWVTVGDLIAKMRTIRQTETEARDRTTRQIKTGDKPVSINIKRIMEDARNGLTPEEIGQRARESAEASGGER